MARKSLKTKQKEEHELNQCANDWITCRCGKLFGDDEDSSAKDKFLAHLEKYKLFALSMYYSETITGGKSEDE